MTRSKIERTKALVMGAIAIVFLLIIVGLHLYQFIWIPIVFALFAGLFWWKMTVFARNGQ